MLFRYEYFVCILHSLKSHKTIKFHITKEHLFLRTIFFAFKSPNEHLHSLCNVLCDQFRSDYPLAYYSLPMGLPTFSRVHIVFMNVQKKQFSCRTTG